ncbi:MAG: hypothetical protein JO225_12370 [Candidatus Eremiobacteraeota bacterium]|nr:hypothetical protein [Candidatus Eremiobacteraeota bacterium]
MLAVSLLSAFASVLLPIVLLIPAPAWLAALGVAIAFAYFGAIGAAFTIANRTATGADKRRVSWVSSSLAIGFSGPFVILILVATRLPFADWFQYLALTLLAIPFGLGYAIVRHRVIDIGFVVNRALVFASLSAIVIVAFASLEWLLGTVLVKVSHVTSQTLEWGLALVLGLSLRPIHGRVEALIDDLFFRARHEAEHALRTFAREVGYITDPRVAVARAHAELVVRTGACDAAIYVVDGAGAVRVDPAETAAPAFVGVDDPALVRLRATRAPTALAGLESALHGERAFPMCVRDAVSGLAVLGAKSNGEAYAPDEIATIEVVVLALGNALDALQTAALRADIVRVLVDGASVDALRRTIDPAAWVRGVVPQPAGSALGLNE